MEDAFIGYQTDTPATVVLQAAYLIKASHQTLIEGSADWKDEVNSAYCVHLMTYLCLILITDDPKVQEAVAVHCMP